MENIKMQQSRLTVRPSGVATGVVGATVATAGAATAGMSAVGTALLIGLGCVLCLTIIGIPFGILCFLAAAASGTVAVVSGGVAAAGAGAIVIGAATSVKQTDSE